MADQGTGAEMRILATIAAWMLLAGFASAQEYPLVSAVEAEPMNVRIEPSTHLGMDCLRVTGLGGAGPEIAIVKGSDATDGEIEVELAGRPLPGADASLRGFIGVAFRVQTNDSLRYECFYLRPTNGRAEDQLRRNHSTQYISYPDFPWFRLRKENPGVYESYVDLVPGEWTKVRIQVKGSEARLYVHAADQPCLIVKDLKLGSSHGAIALWIGLGTEAFFRNLRVTTN